MSGPIALAPALVTVSFTVYDPVPVNRTYGRRKRSGQSGFGGKTGLYRRPDAALFKSAIERAALAARMTTPGWPNDPLRVAKARLSYQLFDYAGDTDGVRKPLRDSIQKILIHNDRDVEDGPATFPILDGAGRRVVVYVEMTEERSAAAASALADRIRKNALKRALRGPKHTTRTRR